MGFGLCLIGYFLYIFSIYGLGIIGCPIMAWGLFKLRRLDKLFGYAAIVALLLCWNSVINILLLTKLMSESERFLTISKCVQTIFESAFFTLFLAAIITVTSKPSPRIKRNAKTLLYSILIFNGWVIFQAFANLNAFNAVLLMGDIVLKIVILLFIFDCYAKITTRRQAALDDKYHRELQAKYEEKKRKQEQKNKED